MKLKRLKVSKAYGYLDIDISFNKDLTLLLGINGSGKTTALKLIEALTTPNLSLLDKIPHDSAELTLLDGRKKVLINSKVSSKYTRLAIPSKGDGYGFEYAHPEADIANDAQVSASPRVDPYSLLQREFAALPAYRYLVDEVSIPIVLGLERRNASPSLATQSDVEETRRRHYSIISVKRRMAVSGMLSTSMLDVQVLIQEIYRQIRDEQEKFAAKLREDMFLEAFDYQPSTGFFKTLLDGGESQAKFLGSILSKRTHVESALRNAGLLEERWSLVVAKFFQHLTALKEKADSKAHNKSSGAESVAIELAFNRPVVDRVLRLIKSSESYNENVNRLWRPITDFLALVNRFLIDCDKELCIDKVGWLNVKLKGGDPLSIDVLSSGERQIVVILGHLAISRELNQERIFIVDEPELSLHLKWQQIFVESILAANQNSQFVLATHSPAIVMNLGEMCVSLDNKTI